ncbi:MAG: efflux RND transporter periplasmic adaptor subunit [candidate division Zixibacteria bacterium]|nr:efflux RND transporter periplasmic adaptor subunit [Candidatus Tariuqbacter arcticus]
MAKTKKKSKKKLFIILGIVIVLAVIVLANVLRKPDTALAVQIDEVERGTIVQTVSASGKIKPVVEVKISAKVSGNIIDLFVEEGDSVHKGDFLLRLDRERYQAAVERAESGLKSSKASLWKAEMEYNRLKELHRKNLASIAELQTAEANMLLSEGQVEQSEAILREARDDLSKTEIYSPMDGVVSQMNKEKGEMVLGASFQEDVIMVIADLSQMEAEVEVDENDVVYVSTGDPVEIEIDAFPDTVFKGEVTRIANSAVTRGFGTQDEVTNFIVEISVLENIDGVRPGMSATVDIEVERHDDAIQIPIQCVAMRYPEVEGEEESEEGKDESKKGERRHSKYDRDRDEEDMIEVVFVVEEGDTVSMTPVKTGITSDTDIEILDGLDEGQKVVSGPYRILANKIEDGDLVKEDKSFKERESEEEAR